VNTTIKTPSVSSKFESQNISESALKTNQRFKPELLSPAGSLEAMRMAFAYGADAVYAGLPRYSLRARNNDFDRDTIQKGIEEAHADNKLFYLATNIAPHNSKVNTFIQDIAPIVAMKPDALIMSDPGLIMMVRETWPDQEVHLSVQANAVNYATVNFWAKQGLSRIILSRELSIREIEEIRSQCPQTELEIFVHGALCIAYSGRCLLSGYMNKRDPNQGTCTNACRWKYQAHEAKQTDSGDIIIKNAAQSDTSTSTQTVLLQEAGRPDELMPMFEDEHGTYIMNSKDLRAIQHVEKFVDMGIHSLKIEGRTKSPYYVARTAQTYRQAIDDAVYGKKFDMHLMDELEKLASRGYTEGFYRRHVHDEYQNYQQGNSMPTTQQLVGDIIDCKEDKLLIQVKNKFQLGDSVEVMTTRGNRHFEIGFIESKQGQAKSEAPGSGHIVWINRPPEMEIDTFSMLLRNF
jgi:U32 family peptidase